MTRRHTRRRAVVVAALVVGAAVTVLLLWWHRPAPVWRLSLDTSDTGVLPWASVDLTATIVPDGAPRQPLDWTWTVDSDVFSHDGPSATWRTGAEGTHRIEVTAVAADGTVHAAHVDIVVARPASVPRAPAVVSAQSPAADAGPSLPFEIADVWVEKRSVCQGEATRVRVTVNDARGDQRWLRPNIAGVNAWEIEYVPPLGAEGLQPIHVNVVDDRLHRAGVEADAFVEVDHCVVRHPILVRQQMIAPDAEVIAFSAITFRGGDLEAWMRAPAGQRAGTPTADVSSYEWDFGDGVRETSRQGRVSHRYPPEVDRGEELQSVYPVKVVALDGDGQTLGTGFTTVVLRNLVRDLKRNLGVLQLLAAVPPGPAPAAADGSRYADVVLRNIDGTETARMSDLSVTLVACDGQSTTKRSLQPGAVFSSDTVPPNGTVSGRFAIPADDAKACSVSVRISGSSRPHDLRVTGTFALDPGTRAREAVSGRQAALLRQAGSLLGNPRVITMADVERLEEEGTIPRGVLVPDPFAPLAPEK